MVLACNLCILAGNQLLNGVLHPAVVALTIAQTRGDGPEHIQFFTENTVQKQGENHTRRTVRPSGRELLDAFANLTTLVQFAVKRAKLFYFGVFCSRDIAGLGTGERPWL